jgi:hypothetical protein
LVPARGGDDFVRICGPDEWFWPLIMIGVEAVDGGLEIEDAFEGAAFEAAFGETVKKPSMALSQLAEVGVK